MSTSVYNINKGINKPIEFKGLKAQYIGYLAAGLVVLLVLFAILYIIGVNMFICLGLNSFTSSVDKKTSCLVFNSSIMVCVILLCSSELIR